MTHRTAALILVLLLVAAFEGGVAFDRWLHRPIRAGGFTVDFPTTSQVSVGTPPSKPRCFTDGSVPCAPGPKPTPDCNNDGLQKCEPNDDAGDYEPNLHPWGSGRTRFDPPNFGERECWWRPFGFNVCQKET